MHAGYNHRHKQKEKKKKHLPTGIGRQAGTGTGRWAGIGKSGHGARKHGCNWPGVMVQPIVPL